MTPLRRPFDIVTAQVRGAVAWREQCDPPTLTERHARAARSAVVAVTAPVVAALVFHLAGTVAVGPDGDFWSSFLAEFGSVVLMFIVIGMAQGAVPQFIGIHADGGRRSDSAGKRHPTTPEHGHRVATDDRGIDP